MSPLLPTILLAVAGSVVLGPYILNSLIRVSALRRLGGGMLLWRLAVLAFLLAWFIPYYSDKGMDAIRYHFQAIAIDQAIGTGRWHELTWGFGTPAMCILMALLYFPFGATLNGAFVVGTLVGLVAAILFVKAASTLRYRKRDLKTYAVLLMLLPSFAMWTSVAGKDSWVSLGLGLFSYGYARLIRRSGGTVHLLLGAALITVIRPHIGTILLASMLASMVLAKPLSRTNVLQRVCVIAIGIVGLGCATWAASQFLGVYRGDSQDMFAVAKTISEGNRLGGSSVDTTKIDSVGSLVVSLPEAVVRILFRPFPWEVINVNAGLAALENLLILFLVVQRIKKVRAIARMIIVDRYLLFCMLTVIQMIIILAPIPNLGLLSRMRAQLLPFLFAVLLMPSVQRRRHPMPAVARFPGYRTAISGPTSRGAAPLGAS
jgi:hypothetical protein